MTVSVETRLEHVLDLIADIDRLEDDLDDLLSMEAMSSMEPPDGFFRQPLGDVLEKLDEESLAKLIGERVRSLREEHSLTQKDLSSRCGILRPNIARLESGSNLPSLATLLKIASGMQIPLGYLLP